MLTPAVELCVERPTRKDSCGSGGVVCRKNHTKGFVRQRGVRAAGNNPLYIVDGIPYSTDAIGSGASKHLFLYNSIPDYNSNNLKNSESLIFLASQILFKVYRVIVYFLSL
jgi:hypothetical protein